MTVHLAIHCHFYQPPRENPWLEEIERQDSAEPYHDWNCRIADESFTANGWARILDENSLIVDIVNNYRYISFNVGPTLMSWLEEKVPHTYQRILEADRLSVSERSGHGNAIAQAYNHMILPLANLRDKLTQVRWGLADFRYRFNREAESIWLPETAVDYPTLEVLIDHGMKYVILSPHQAAQCRAIGDEEWSDVNDGSIDPTQAYRCFLNDGSGRSIDVFFYDGPVSRSIGFEDLLHSADKLVDRFEQAVSDDREHVQLICAATDGETYGHHKSLGEMALAYAAVFEAPERGFKLTNFGEFLEFNPPVHEAEIKSVSSWSCAHGVGRWTENCGCFAGNPRFHQRWRAPLRSALDWLRDILADVFEKEGAFYFNSPWEARDDYISVILDRSPENISAFMARHGKSELEELDYAKALLLLEMQRHAMLMYTSCAWFFCEISGIETVQTLLYAARAIEIAAKFSDVEDEKDLEEEFVKRLEQAPSNISEYGTGEAVYRKLVKPSTVGMERLANYHAVNLLFEDLPKRTRIFCFEVDRLDYKSIRRGRPALSVGRLKLRSVITGESSDLAFGLLHSGDHDFYCAVQRHPGDERYQRAKRELFERFQEGSLMEMLRRLDESFGPQCFTFRDLLIEKRREILRGASDQLLQRFADTYEQIYEENISVIAALKADGLPVPNEYRIAAEYTLTRRFNNGIDRLSNYFDQQSYKEILPIAAEMRKNGYILDMSYAIEKLSAKLNDRAASITAIADEWLTKEDFEEVSRFLEMIGEMGISLELRQTQNRYFDFLKSRISKPTSWTQAAIELGERLRFNVKKILNVESPENSENNSL